MKLRWGICGAGKISSDFCHAVRTLPESEHEVIAVASRSTDRAKQFSDKHGLRRSYESYAGLTDDAEIDAIYIGTWHRSHAPLSKMMLNAGKHVLCEKPLCLNVEQVQELYQLAKDKNKFLMEAMWSRTFPIYHEIRKAIQSGSLGEIQLVTATLAYPAIEEFKDGFDGALFLSGMYPIQFANWVFNNEKPEKIIAVSDICEMGYDKDGCVILSYKNGAKASLSFSAKCYGAGANSAVVYGTKGMIQIPDRFWCPDEATLPSGKLTVSLEPTDPSVYYYPNGLGLKYEAECVRKCIMEGMLECPTMSREDSLAIYRITDEIRQQLGLNYKLDEWTDESTLT